MTSTHATQAGEAWAKAGIGEHASVAAFARFVLDLMSLGSPPSLIRDAIQAMADEVEHARLCFGLSKLLTGVAVGPGRLDLSNIFEQRGDAASIMQAAILEGCFGETIAARYARVALERAEEPLVRTALERIADDEARHAELSWRFVRWALEAYPELRPVASVCFAETLVDFRARGHTDAAPVEDDWDLEKYGHLGSSSKRLVAESVLCEVIEPRMKGLLGCSLAGGVDAPPRGGEQARGGR